MSYAAEGDPEQLVSFGKVAIAKLSNNTCRDRFILPSLSYFSEAKYEGGKADAALNNVDVSAARFLEYSKDDCTSYGMDASACAAHTVVYSINKSIYGVGEPDDTQSLYVAVPACTDDLQNLKL